MSRVAAAEDPAAAWRSGFYVNVGPGALMFSEGAAVSVAGLSIPGAQIRIRPNETLVVEGGYRQGPLGASLTVGVPPKATVNGDGTLSPLGRLGQLRYGPATLTAHYHLDLGRFQPYVGGGPVFLIVFNDSDAALRHLRVRSNVGGVVQAGAEYALTPSAGLFLDAKRAFLKTSAEASILGAPVRASITLDPLVLTGGVSFHF